ncbi:MAG: hypothetical protein WCD89_12990 [Anaerocolumna sp.]
MDSKNLQKAFIKQVNKILPTLIHVILIEYSGSTSGIFTQINLD